METDDIIISDLFNFFDTLSNTDKNVGEIAGAVVPYLAFVILSNEKAYRYVDEKLNDWTNEKISCEFKKCPWIKCSFIARMIDIEKERKIINILIYLCADEVDVNAIYEILTFGWRRISLYVDNAEYIDLNEAPVRNKIEEKWALCFMAYIKNKIVIQSKNRKEWYRIASSLFFYFEYIVQYADIDPIYINNEKLPLKNDEKLFYGICEKQDSIDFTCQDECLLKAKEMLMKSIICSQRNAKTDVSALNIFPIYKKKEEMVQNKERKTDRNRDEVEYLEKQVVELKEKNKAIANENEHLKSTINLLNDELDMLRTVDGDGIVYLEYECDLAYLYQKRIVICGGRLEWLNAIKQKFPNWKYIENDDIHFDGKILRDIHIDAIVFNRKFVSHGLFYKIASQKSKSTPLLYINSSNYDYSIYMIYNKLKKMECERNDNHCL